MALALAGERRPDGDSLFDDVLQLNIDGRHRSVFWNPEDFVELA
jgi:hypothetical protein